MQKMFSRFLFISRSFLTIFTFLNLLKPFPSFVQANSSDFIARDNACVTSFTVLALDNPKSSAGNQNQEGNSANGQNDGHETLDEGHINSFSNPGPASPLDCTDTKPTAAPGNLHIIDSTLNTVTLAWNAVEPATHYALIFTRDADGEQYGSSNIGNITQYTITNLSGTDSYSFELMAINGCMPGDRAKVLATVTGPGLDSRPQGEDGQVLGLDDELKAAFLTSSPTSVPGSLKADQAKVKGASTQNTETSKLRQFLPWTLGATGAIAFLLMRIFHQKKPLFNGRLNR